MKKQLILITVVMSLVACSQENGDANSDTPQQPQRVMAFHGEVVWDNDTDNDNGVTRTDVPDISTSLNSKWQTGQQVYFIKTSDAYKRKSSPYDVTTVSQYAAYYYTGDAKKQFLSLDPLQWNQDIEDVTAFYRGDNGADGKGSNLLTADFSVETDQSDYANYQKSDFVYFRGNVAYNNTGLVNIQFKHKVAQMRVIVKCADISKVTNVVIGGNAMFGCTATVTEPATNGVASAANFGANYNTGYLTVKANPNQNYSNITMYRFDDTSSADQVEYRCFVIPQYLNRTTTSGYGSSSPNYISRFIDITYNGTHYYYINKASANGKFTKDKLEEGKHYTFVITLKDTREDAKNGTTDDTANNY